MQRYGKIWGQEEEWEKVEEKKMKRGEWGRLNIYSWRKRGELGLAGEPKAVYRKE